MHDSYATKCLESTLEGLKRQLSWDEELVKTAEKESKRARAAVKETSKKIEEVEQDLSFLRNY